MKNGFGNEGSFIMWSSAQRKKNKCERDPSEKEKERENTFVTYILHAYLRKVKNMQDML